MRNNKLIPKSQSDRILENWGYDLVEEYYQLISSANLNTGSPVFDIATGTGRAVSVLTRLGYDVITGDYDFNKKNETDIRITSDFLEKVKFMELNIEELPFNDNYMQSIVCINTMHELENPIRGLSELIRVLASNGKLLIADFNPEGFDVMDKLHLQRFGKLHPRGIISNDDIYKILSEHFSAVTKIHTQLNNAFIVENKLT